MIDSVGDAGNLVNCGRVAAVEWPRNIAIHTYILLFFNFY